MSVAHDPCEFSRIFSVLVGMKAVGGEVDEEADFHLII